MKNTFKNLLAVYAIITTALLVLRFNSCFSSITEDSPHIKSKRAVTSNMMRTKHLDEPQKVAQT